MARSTGGPTHSRKRKRVLKRAKGFRAGPGTLYRQAIEFTLRAGRPAHPAPRPARRPAPKEANGVRARPGTLYRQAIEFPLRAGRYAYRDRRQKKRHFRQLWIV